MKAPLYYYTSCLQEGLLRCYRPDAFTPVLYTWDIRWFERNLSRLGTEDEFLAEFATTRRHVVAEPKVWIGKAMACLRAMRVFRYNQ